MAKRFLLFMTVLFLLLSSVVAAVVFIKLDPVTGPSDSQVRQDTRAKWYALSVNHLKLEQVLIDERDIMAADRVRFELTMYFQHANDPSLRQVKRSVIYRLFGNTWRESRY